MKKNKNDSGLGATKIHHEVIAAIASVATQEVPGVAGMKSSLKDGLNHLLTHKGTEKGIKIKFHNGNVDINIAVEVDYGSNIPKVVKQVQEKVKNNVEQMTGLKLANINIDVCGVDIDQNNKPKEEK